jgi:hypothetical protein
MSVTQLRKVLLQTPDRRTPDKEPNDQFMPAPILCPDCGSPMRLLAITPKLMRRKTGEISYRCEGCDIELRRVAKTA